ncbi:hypothetical protein N825_08705 [Skermanella stibiiresistens SB22]|uniref:Uncharacterized protein n=1 Tax=Skermanella stibiiresistens SB22 TaxID=1385369 RepID=W9H5N9_9PROT|nr:hypothetical protein N825_08705 [Skermanella stibiiresistens SB22]
MSAQGIFASHIIVTDVATRDGWDTGIDQVPKVACLGLSDLMVHLDGSRDWGPLVKDMDLTVWRWSTHDASSVRFHMSSGDVRDLIQGLVTSWIRLMIGRHTRLATAVLPRRGPLDI